MKRRNFFTSDKSGASLPSLSSPSSSYRGIDGSGRGVHMDAPIIRGWKQASGFTKGSYYWLFISLFAIIWSIRFMMNDYATTYLDCVDEMCTLKIIPPNRAPKFITKIHREQIISTKEIKVSSNGNFIPDTNDSSIPYDRRYQNANSNKDDIFDSYGLILSQEGRGAVKLHELEIEYEEEKRTMEHYNDDGYMMDEIMSGDSLSQEQKDLMRKFGRGGGGTNDRELHEQYEIQKQKILEEAKKGLETRNKAHQKRLKEIQDKKEELRVGFVNRGMEDYPDLMDLENGWSEMINGYQYMVIMRKYDILHRRRRVTSLMKSIMNYADGKRDKLVIRENRNIAWQGILGLVFGMFSILLCLLIGQFWEPQRQPKRFNNANHANSIRRKHISHLNTQGPPTVPKNFPSSANRKQAPMRQKAYGGYVPGKSTY